MPTEEFFDERREQSEVKATIVAKYFRVWAQIMLRNLRKYGGNRIAYIDLFCGPGRYMDGKPSTPSMIVEEAIRDTELSQKLVTWFVDKNQGWVDSLRKEIEKIPNIGSLAHRPVILCRETNDALAEFFESKSIIPTLLFLDPCGYKGVTLRLIKSVLKDWGCDCIVFFNYNRINPGLDNPSVKGHMDNLFGEQRAEQLRKELQELPPAERELSIVNEFSLALQDFGGEYVLPFRFKRADGGRTSHYLMFVSKHVLGYKKMKEIMAACGSDKKQGVPTFQYTTAGPQQQLLFQLARPL